MGVHPSRIIIINQMDIEGQRTGTNQGTVYRQARPETVHSQKDMAIMKTYVLDEKGKLLTERRSSW